jgi:hypothetical protein
VTVASLLLTAPRGTQTIVTALVGGGLLALSFTGDSARRRNGGLALLAVLLVGMVILRLRLGVPEGDYRTYTQDTSHFEQYLNVSPDVQYQSFLGSTIVGLLYRVFGHDAAAMRPAFTTYASLAATGYVVAAATVGYLERWSTTALRYLALVTVAPPVLLFFGYRELGYEPLAPLLLAFPLLVTGLERRQAWRIRAAGALLGLACALHGYAIFAAVTGVALAALLPGEWKARLRDALDVAAYAVASYLVWIPLYIVAGKTIKSGHAGHLDFRPWFHRTISQHRYDWPVFSVKGGGAIVLMLLMAGPLLYLPLLANRPRRWRVLLATVPILLFFVKFWPVQGPGNDTDLAVGTFGAVFLLAWTCARERRPTLAGFGLLLAAQSVFWIATTSRFVVGPVPSLLHHP